MNLVNKIILDIISNRLKWFLKLQNINLHEHVAYVFSSVLAMQTLFHIDHTGAVYLVSFYLLDSFSLLFKDKCGSGYKIPCLNSPCKVGKGISLVNC